MSIYIGDDEILFQRSVESLWCNQSVRPSEIILVKDGLLSERLEVVIRKLKAKNPGVFKVKALERNLGLGAALNYGLNFVSNELVARMDADDVSLPDRFEKQLKFMNDNPDISASSGYILEFDKTMKNQLGLRKVPVDADKIHKFSKRRSPLNHVAVMFRKHDILAVGGYPPLRKAQDYALWSLLLQKGYNLGNLADILVNVRAGDGLIERRGVGFLNHEIELLKFQRNIGFLSCTDFYINLLIRSFARLSPNIIKKFIYKFILRKQNPE